MKASGRIAFLADDLSDRRLAARPAKARYEAQRTGDILHSQADIQLARKLLAYESSVNFEEGLRRTWEWYLSEYAPTQQRLAGS